MKKYLIQLLIIVPMIVVVIGAVAFGWLVKEFKSSGAFELPTVVNVESGMSVKAISELVSYHTGDTNTALIFEAGVRLFGHGAPLQAGEYRIKADSSLEDAMRVMQMGRVLQHQVTIAEGLSSHEVIAVLGESEKLIGELDNVPPEGTLLPETYNFIRGTTKQQVVRRMHEAMTTTLAELWDNRADNLPIITMQQAVTLASIVEKETGVASERAKVAGVFMNRLRLRMPLQTDPTVIYALTKGERDLGRPLTYNDLETQSPYNTYVVNGLPPGPICNPGRAALEATLNPDDHDYLYFVADGTGGHAFAETLKGHNENVAKWRKIRKDRRNDRKTRGPEDP